MFQENLKELRKKKGFSQQELAIRLNVVRQTISKWEKGLSVPDADTLIKMAEIFEVSVNELLGAKLEVKDEEKRNVIAEQLVRINEQLAIKNNRWRKIWKTIGIVLLVSFIVSFIICMLANILYFVDDDTSGSKEITKLETMENFYVEDIV